MVSPFVHIFDIVFLFAAQLEEPKIGIWGKGLSIVVSYSYYLTLHNFSFDMIVINVSLFSFVF